LPADLQIQLKRHIQVFLAEKPFIGCDGLEVTDEMRVTIAAQACLLLLNRRRADYFPNLRRSSSIRARSSLVGFIRMPRRAAGSAASVVGRIVVAGAGGVVLG
jgi:hypothetical protein